MQVGVGTGLNLSLYDWPRVRSLVGLDLSAGMLTQARQRAVTLTLGDRLSLQQGELASFYARIYVPTSFDSVQSLTVSTQGLC